MAIKYLGKATEISISKEKEMEIMMNHRKIVGNGKEEVATLLKDVGKEAERPDRVVLERVKVPQPETVVCTTPALPVHSVKGNLDVNEQIRQAINQSVVLNRANNIVLCPTPVYKVVNSKGWIRKKSPKRSARIYNGTSCKKITIPDEIANNCKFTPLVQVGNTDKGILICNVLSPNKKGDGYFELKKQGGMYCIHSKPLVKEVLDNLGLDDTQKSLKFCEVEYTTVKRKMAVHLKLIK